MLARWGGGGGLFEHINPQLAVQGPFGTAEGYKTMTATPETSLEVNTGP